MEPSVLAPTLGPAQRRPTPAQALTGLAFVAALFAYPFFGEALLARYGVSRVAGGVFVATAAVCAIRALSEGGSLRLLARHAGALALLALAWVTGERLYLLLFPALVNLALAVVFARTLGDEQSIVERVARIMHPYLPDFTRAYCKATTVMWIGFFALSAVGIAWVAFEDPEHWRFATTTLYVGVLCGLAIVEFFFRKIWFRYYVGGPVDRVLAHFFPSGATERGRRSAAYMDRMRELGW